MREFFRKNEGIVRDGLVALRKCEPTAVTFQYQDACVAVRLRSGWVGHFYTTQLPGCCGVAVLYELCTDIDGLGRLLLDFAEKSIRDAGYAMIIGTTNNEQDRMNKILPLRGWVRHKRFINARTQNECYVWSKRLMSSDEAMEFYPRDEYGDIVEEDEEEETPVGV